VSNNPSLLTALRVAFRHVDDADTSDLEHEAILTAIAEHAPDAEAEMASRALFHLREQRRLQLTLRSILEAPKA
jgi:hypothetical protein